MPIKPENKRRYPANWREIRAAIMERAGDRCERCGRPHGVRVMVIRDGGWLDPETGEQCDERGQFMGLRRMSEWPDGWFTTTILTCAHLDQNPENNDPANLRALCQRCHNRHDLPHRIQNAARTRRAKQPTGDLFDNA